MTEVTIRNRGLLHTLDSFVDMFYSIPEDIRCSKEHQTLSSQQAADDPEYFCGEEYLISQKALGSRHSGYPEEYYSHPVTHMVKSNPEIFTEFKDRVKHQFASEIGAHTSALLNYYPPGGFVDGIPTGMHIVIKYCLHGQRMVMAISVTGTIKSKKSYTHKMCRVGNVDTITLED